MVDDATPKARPVKSPAKRSGSRKWAVVGSLALAIYVASRLGWTGWAWSHAMAQVFPRDESLLAWVPIDTTSVAIVDPHQIELGALGSEQTALRTGLVRMREDVRKATGVDLWFDVDKLVLSPAVVVARGRFDAEALGERLAELRYQRESHEGRLIWVRTGEDALAVVGSEILLYGDVTGVKAAIDGKVRDRSLDNDDKVKERLRKVGWDHAVLATVTLADDKPSLRSMITGSTGPRSLTVGVRSQAGLDVDGRIETTSPSTADELAKLLDERRATADAALGGAVGGDLAKLLAEIVKNAQVRADGPNSAVVVHVHASQEAVDGALRAAAKSPELAQAYKTLRLAQLLLP